jgi:SNF2 family DNA or RNA helicase
MGILTEELGTQIEQPTDFGKVRLFPFQLASVHAMEELEKKKISWVDGSYSYEGNTSLGVLGNKVGSGKTNILLVLAQRNKTKFTGETYNKVTTENSFNGRINIISNITLSVIPGIHSNITLIIVPHTIFNQWISEIKKTTVKYLKVGKPEDFEIPDAVDGDGGVDVIICAATKFRRFFSKFHYIVWNRVIFDEADSMRGINQLIRFNFMWLVSATYKNLIHNTVPSIVFNTLGFGSSIMDQILIKCSEEYIDKYLNFNNIVRHYIVCNMNKSLVAVSDYITPEIQNMINGDDIEGAMKALGGTTENEDTLTQLISKKIQNEIGDRMARIEYIKNIHSMSALHKERSITKNQEKIDSLHERFNSIKDTIKNLSTDMCAICIDNYTNPVLLPCCNNIFCLVCITKALEIKRECVLCRQSVLLSQLTYVTSSKDSERLKPKKPISTLKSKEDNCIEIILRNPQKKFLVFSNYDGSFTRLKNSLRSKNIGHSEVKGDVDTIERIVRRFNEGHYNVLFLNSRYAGSGLNLEATTDIIIYHNTKLETQIIGRALRAGRDPEMRLDIHYLQYENEVSAAQ